MFTVHNKTGDRYTFMFLSVSRLNHLRLTKKVIISIKWKNGPRLHFNENLQIADVNVQLLQILIDSGMYLVEYPRVYKQWVIVDA